MLITTKNLVQYTLKITSGILGISIVLQLLFPENYAINLLRSMLPLLGLFVLFILSLSFLFRNPFSIVVNLISFSIVAFLLFSVIQFPTYKESDLFDLKIAHFNVLKYNTDYNETIQLAMESNADIISFQETNTPWTRHLSEKLSFSYPYKIIVPRDLNCFGMAIFSKYPLSNIQHLKFGNVPNIGGIINKGSKKINFIASHTIPPTLKTTFNKRNNHINEIAQYLQTLKGPKIAIGDYNTVPWDQQLIRFKSRTNLMDGRPSFSSTYPSWLITPIIPIDYIFHSEDFECTNFDTIKTNASDHYGIFGCYKLK